MKLLLKELAVIVSRVQNSFKIKLPTITIEIKVTATVRKLKDSKPLRSKFKQLLGPEKLLRKAYFPTDP